MSLAGVDEAGRGPVLGPLVVASILAPNERPLRKLGVKDSKLLTPKKREELAPQIRKLADRIELRVIHAEELNARMPTQNLNEIEVDAFAELLQRLAPKTAVLDACDVDAARFGRNVAARITHPTTIRAEHEADAKHAIVAAASILAKIERDRHMAEISAQHGPCGSGYSHDATTRQWLATYVRTHNKLPHFARREWETSKRLLQRDLTQYLPLTPDTTATSGAHTTKAPKPAPTTPKKPRRRNTEP